MAVDPSSAPAETPAAEKKDTRQLPVLAVVRVNELRANLTQEMVETLIEECLSDLTARLPGLQRTLRKGVGAEVTAHAHAMVGMAAGYGMAALEAELRNILDKAREGDVDAIREAARPVETQLALAAKAWRQELRKELV